MERKTTENGLNGVHQKKFAPKKLSDREMQVFMLVAEGWSNKQIAAELFLSLNTIETHTRSIIGKLGAHNMKHAVTLAMRRKLIK